MLKRTDFYCRKRTLLVKMKKKSYFSRYSVKTSMTSLNRDVTKTDLLISTYLQLQIERRL